jgi:hypothetical protein
MAEDIPWAKLPGRDAGIQYYESEPTHKGYRSFMKGFASGKIKPEELVRVYAKPTVPREPADNAPGWRRSTNAAVLGFETYLVDNEGNLRRTLYTDKMNKVKAMSPGAVLGREKSYRILK